MNEFLIDDYGTQIWYDLKSYKRDDFSNINYRVSLLNGDAFYVRLHNENGPALISKKLSKHYYMYGQRHCEYGPASVWYNDSIQWFLNDNEYSFEKWCKKLNKSEEEINFLRLKWNIV